ncbi:hypothetical protein HJC99_06805 [Candidatus Saccharibacteria bacterium]|nr:hypothetical protein [Candidatus Saccharibacteria bacterium]
MVNQPHNLSPKQQLYREMVLGTLVYAVVLGFFNDYTSIITTKSYSTTFLAAFVLQILTYLTLLTKAKVSANFKQRTGRWNKLGHVLGVWLVLFLSKFVFLAVIDYVFGDNVNISGFIGLVVIIVTMTVAKEGIDYVFNRLAD